MKPRILSLPLAPVIALALMLSLTGCAGLAPLDRLGAIRESTTPSDLFSVGSEYEGVLIEYNLSVLGNIRFSADHLAILAERRPAQKAKGQDGAHVPFPLDNRIYTATNISYTRSGRLSSITLKADRIDSHNITQAREPQEAPPDSKDQDHE